MEKTDDYTPDTTPTPYPCPTGQPFTLTETGQVNCILPQTGGEFDWTGIALAILLLFAGIIAIDARRFRRKNKESN